MILLLCGMSADWLVTVIRILYFRKGFNSRFLNTCMWMHANEIAYAKSYTFTPHQALTFTNTNTRHLPISVYTTVGRKVLMLWQYECHLMKKKVINSAFKAKQRWVWVQTGRLLPPNSQQSATSQLIFSQLTLSHPITSTSLSIISQLSKLKTCSLFCHSAVSTVCLNLHPPRHHLCSRTNLISSASAAHTPPSSFPTSLVSLNNHSRSLSSSYSDIFSCWAQIPTFLQAIQFQCLFFKCPSQNQCLKEAYGCGT